MIELVSVYKGQSRLWYLEHISFTIAISLSYIFITKNQITYIKYQYAC